MIFNMFDPHYSEYIPEKLINFSMSLGKTREQAIRSWISVNNGICVNYDEVHKNEETNRR